MTLSDAPAKMQNKNALIDNFQRVHTYLRISVTDRCNLRCAYCMPAEGIVYRQKKELLTFEEIERVASIMVRLGVTKIRLTGGEPMVRRDIEKLVYKLAGIEGLKTLAMTTNATLLGEKAGVLKKNGIKALNISLDTLRRERFLQVTRRDQFDQVWQGIQSALAQDFEELKLNSVVMSGFNDDELLDFAEFAFNNKINVRFIEFMPFKDNEWNIEKVVTYKEMIATLESCYKLTPISADPSAVGKDFSLADKNGKPGKGTVSFITSMSDSFCSTCNRLRITADGSVKSCLFYPAEINLRDRMRDGATDAEVEEMIRYSLSLKPEAHAPAEELSQSENRTMIEIGG
ncbi:MAG: GTP 3',8-cyclase MoaA [Candidatus Obscuribacterales bacterium]|nr:GTP 3',8-cyclase MoaA [Candidatus Obscuribacterales bacterium]